MAENVAGKLIRLPASSLEFATAMRQAREEDLRRALQTVSAADRPGIRERLLRNALRGRLARER